MKEEKYKTSTNFGKKAKPFTQRSKSLMENNCKKDSMGRRNYLERFCLYAGKPLLRLN